MTPFRRVVQHARKWRLCADHYAPGSSLIGVGDPCVVLSLPPRADLCDGIHWWTLSLHPECERGALTAERP